MSDYTKEYFENRKQQNKIKLLVNEAIPVGVYYHNLIIAFAEMLTDFTWQSFKKDVFKKEIKKD